MGTGPLAALKSLSVRCMSLALGQNVAAVVAAAALGEEDVEIGEEAGVEASKGPCGSRQRDVD